MSAYKVTEKLHYTLIAIWATPRFLRHAVAEPVSVPTWIPSFLNGPDFGTFGPLDSRISRLSQLACNTQGSPTGGLSFWYNQRVKRTPLAKKPSSSKDEIQNLFRGE